MNNNTFFSYYWFLDERETEITSIRVYGVNKNKSICLIIDDFRPYIYLELPEKISWTSNKAKLLKNKINDLLKNYKPLYCELRLKHKLYGAHLTEDGEKKLFPYLYCEFSNKGDIQKLYYAVRKGITVAGLGTLNLKIHEQDADPILQFVSNADIPTAGWISFKGKEVAEDDKVTYCDREYNVKWKNVKRSDKTEISKPKIMGFDIEVNSMTGAFPNADTPGDKIFQISCVFSREGYTEDQYDIYLLTLGEPDPKKVGENVNIYMYDTEAELIEGFTELILEENPNIISGYNIFKFDIPYMINRAKYPCMCLNNFDKLGFNRYTHAKEKIIKWSFSAYGNQEFEFLDAEGRLFIDLLPLVQRNYKLSSYALKAVSAKFIKDTKRDLDEKGIFKCYRLGTKKEADGTYSEKAKTAMSICGRYCVQDTVLVIKLMDYFQTWFDLTEQATTYNTSIFSLYTQGQQIKVFSQVYKYNIENNIVTEKDVYQTGENERYVGAHVFEPVPGLYDRVLPFDFASLYPSTIIAYNIDYSTWVTDESILDELCHVFKWEDHLSCQHDPKVIRKNTLTAYIDEEKKKIDKMMEKRDNKLNKYMRNEIQEEINKKRLELKPYTKERSEITSKLSKKPMCEKRYYRFLKAPLGVIPTILQNLLDARKNVRKQIKINEKIIEKDKIKLAIVSILKGCNVNIQKKELEKLENQIKVLESLNSVLNKRQLAYKVSANSMYGAMGVKKGYLPFMPGAMCTTYMGRVNIEIVAKVITTKYGGKLIYGDSVTGDTPILCRIDGKIYYKTIDDIPHLGWRKYRDEKEDAITKDIEVWTEKGFTKIKNIIRHKTTKKIYRVLTHTGVVDVTEDHGLLDKNANKISPKEIQIGSELLISDLPIDIKYDFEGINKELAFVMGLFYADGSCGNYDCPSGNKCSWAINNTDRDLLEKCNLILNNSKKDSEYEIETLSFRILETMKSSAVLKLVPFGKGVKPFINKWRDLFYDKDRYKKVPDEILWSSEEVRQSFLDGYYCGDGDKDKNGYYRFDNKGKIGSSGLYFLATSLGYKCSINTRKDKQEVYRITCTKKSQRKKENKVKKIELLGKTEQYVYDLETENHHFSAGVGKLIVHNTDSNYVHFTTFTNC